MFTAVFFVLQIFQSLTFSKIGFLFMNYGSCAEITFDLLIWFIELEQTVKYQFVDVFRESFGAAEM